MLSYRHAFHAGNFADVLKHRVLIHIIEHLKQKEKPFFYLDTHAGAGVYALSGEFAQKNREFEGGIGRLWNRRDLPDGIRRYVDLVREMNPKDALTQYPGSPAIAAALLRRNDRLALFELHSTEYGILQGRFAKDKRVRIYHADGLSDALGLLPPAERRGLVLIDPSYELSGDYRGVTEALKKMHRRFATGIYALWYPVIERQRIRRLERELQQSGIPAVTLYELSVAPDTRSHGMTGSGMIVINPPWTLHSLMQHELPWLADVLAAEGGQSGYRLETLADEGRT